MIYQRLIPRMPYSIMRIFAIIPFCLSAFVFAQTPLILTPQSENNPQFITSADQTYELRLAMPTMAKPNKIPQSDEVALRFSSFCLGSVERIAVLSGPDYNSAKVQWLPKIDHSEAWTPQQFRLQERHLASLRRGEALRLDFYLKPDTRLQIKELRMDRVEVLHGNGTSAEEIQLWRATLQREWSTVMPVTIREVTVSTDHITIRGEHGGLRDLSLAEVPMHLPAIAPDRLRHMTPITQYAEKTFSLTVPRYITRAERKQDLLLSTWQVCTKNATTITAVSHPHYADTISCRSPQFPAAVLRNKKGLGGWQSGSPVANDIVDLGISAITVNCLIHDLLDLTPSAGASPKIWQGRTYYFNEANWANLDQTMLEAAKHKVMVSAILLILNPTKTTDPRVKLLAHPGCTAQGTFAMPNVCDDDGLSYYGAILDAFYERYTRPDGKYGRVHHTIVHNEVDAGIVWTNAGKIPAENYFDLYQRSMRLCDLIARQYDPHHRTFISLTHHWTKTNPAWYSSRTLLEWLAASCRREGDFPWALAYHPYPQSLLVPRTWEDNQATFTFDTHKITPRNLEVLDAFMKQPAMLYHGKELRPVHLSENGFNSPDYSEKSLRDQAAGMAYAWKKMQGLSSIQLWHYHNWIDNRHEGGLRIGLRRFPDDAEEPFGKKPIYHLYQALSTAAENEACDPYLPVINKKSWREIVQKVAR